MDNTCIKVCGKKFDTGTRVILWDEQDGLSFYQSGKFVPRPVPIDTLRQTINSFVIHHSVTFTAHSMYRGLKARGLSVNFMIDDDVNENGCATIFQLLDVKDYGFSQKGHNHLGAGVEISYYPDAWDHPNRYSQENIDKWGVQPHKIVSDKIKGRTFTVFAPTDAQVKACIHLISGYKKAFPDLELKFPRDENGEFMAFTVHHELRKGLLHHFNIDTQKVDAMGFPTDYVEEEVNRLDQAEKMKTRKGFLNRLLSVFKK